MGRMKLTEKEVEYLNAFVKKGRRSAREHACMHNQTARINNMMKKTIPSWRMRRASVSILVPN
jgi:hypothetical protein